MTTRIIIASRIYAPEVSATSALLQSWATEFRDRGCDVTVLTTTPPPGLALNDPAGIRVIRKRVLRDRQRYVRGYLSYMSFDVPLFFRLLFSKRPALYVVEPPPTTVAVVRIVAGLKRRPYVVDAADLWSDAAAMATNSRFVLWALRTVELWGLRGARHLFAAHQPLIDRFRELGTNSPATPIGFGADTEAFAFEEQPALEAPLLVYAGTHSEWHGAGIFLDAFAEVEPRHPGAILWFIGNGQDREKLKAQTERLGLKHAVQFSAPISPVELSPILSRATTSLASLKPKQGYDYAFTTKVYSSLAAGCPVVFAGVGPTVPFLAESENSHVGEAVEYDSDAVALAMERAIASSPPPAVRAELSAWARNKYSLASIAQRVVATSLGLVGPE